MSWVNKLLDPLNMSPWKSLLIDKYNKFGADKIWTMPFHCIEKLLPQFNIFWRDILSNWSKLFEESLEDPKDILSQPIWFNKNLKIDQKTVFFHSWVQAGIFYVNDLLDENNHFMSLNKLNELYGLTANFLRYNSILSMIPRSWKNIILQSEKLDSVTNDDFEFVKRNKKPTQFFYKKFLSMFSEQPQKQQNKWQNELEVEIDNWEQIYLTPHHCTKSSKYITFQYKILNRILSTNNLLMKCKLKETNLCSFCNETRETILHLLWDCYVVKNLWLEFANFLSDTCNITFNFSASNVILGCDNADALVNFLIILVKYYIYSCRFTSASPNLSGIMNIIKNSYKIEKISASFFKTPAVVEKIEAKWLPLRDVLT